jgi:Flp pilus assembly protein TadB
MRALTRSNEQRDASRIESASSVRLIDRLLWVCPILALVAAALLLWLFGLTLWTAVAVVLLVACPLCVVWVLTAQRAQKANESLHDRP